MSRSPRRLRAKYIQRTNLRFMLRVYFALPGAIPSVNGHEFISGARWHHSQSKECRLRSGRWYMARHSFIQIQKLHDVAGRIDYISSHERQENLYATYQTATLEFWKALAKESQQEFQKSGSRGKCIEARELIIALPEQYLEYDPQEVLERFTNDFKSRHKVECVSALHHNKKMTNYHIHLIFSERQLLENPEIKRAPRNLFYNESSKRVRTKKEILDQSGEVKSGCYIVQKGQIYEQQLFTIKNEYFKDKEFLREEKRLYRN